MPSKNKGIEYDDYFLIFLKVIFGHKHPETFSSMNNLAKLYHKQKKYAVAEKLFLECLELRIEVLGINHQATMITAASLAALRKDIGQFIHPYMM